MKELLRCVACKCENLHISTVFLHTAQDGAGPSLVYHTKVENNGFYNDLKFKIADDRDFDPFKVGNRTREIDTHIELTCEGCNIINKLSVTFHKGSVSLYLR